MERVTPNPGSEDALRLGCRCPVMDNNHGKWPPFPADEGRPEGWWLSMRCPVHGSQREATARPSWLEETPDGLRINDRD
jgi:hypothetical protein